MEIELLESTDKANVIALVGHMGLEATQAIEKKFKKLTSSARKSAVVDLGGVTYISSFGVRLFLDVLQLLEQEDKKLLLVGPPPEVKEVLVACEMDTLAGIYETRAAALAAL